jgi:hypothetical protein
MSAEVINFPTTPAVASTPKAAPIKERLPRRTSRKGCCNTVAFGEYRSPVSSQSVSGGADN